MSEAPYQVSLPVFEGPLDLLLQLIEREKLDISTVSLAQVADQFLAHVRELAQVGGDTLADFLVVAARLVWIKSRLLLPQPAAAAEELEEDPAETLARQLREYKRFKEAAVALRAIEETGYHTYARVAPPPELERRLADSDVTLADLLAAAGRAFGSLPPPPPVPLGVVVPFTLTINDQVRLIRRATADGATVTFRALLSQARHRLEIIVTLLAVLELIKRDKLHVTQADLFGEIILAGVDGTEIEEEEEI
ncbi:MAG: ScpA family protein [Chloroflexi bacterium]|nr:ScpA family protein [Chloroflexota bacterium]